jgi:signal transduction histidine kinase
MAGLGTMIAGIAHEITNPINFVYANMPILANHLKDLKKLLRAYEAGTSSQEIEMLKEEMDLDFVLDDLDTLIGNCMEGAERVRQIVLDLRKFARQDEAEKQEVDIHEGINSTMTIVHNRLKNRITVHKDFGDVPKIFCYPGQLNQVILNLLTNAIDAIEDKGNIWIRTWQEDSYVKISIRDNGQGIPPDVLLRIFDPFFTTKPVGSGTGLGLTVSHQIIERHGGKIEVESEVHVGTMFTISIPKVC